MSRRLPLWTVNEHSFASVRAALVGGTTSEAPTQPFVDLRLATTFSFFLSFYFSAPAKRVFATPKLFHRRMKADGTGNGCFATKLKRDRVTHENESLKCISKCVWMDVKGGFSRGCGIRWKF